MNLNDRNIDNRLKKIGEFYERVEIREEISAFNDERLKNTFNELLQQRKKVRELEDKVYEIEHQILNNNPNMQMSDSQMSDLKKLNDSLSENYDLEKKLHEEYKEYNNNKYLIYNSLNFKLNKKKNAACKSLIRDFDFNAIRNRIGLSNLKNKTKILSDLEIMRQNQNQ